MTLNIVTPQGTIYKGVELTSVTLPTADGVITVLDEHAPLMAVVIPGEVIIRDFKKQETALSISRGIIEVRKGSIVNILADTAERAEEIDIERAEAARQRAMEYLERAETISEKEVELIQAEIEKELARINVGRKYKNVGGQMGK